MPANIFSSSSSSSSSRDTALSRLADDLGVSRATVSKTIRHCSGVDTETRQRILRAARGVDELRPAGTCAIYCILPDTPSFFWKEMRRGIADGIAAEQSPLSVKCNVYSRLRDEESVLCYLDEAEEMDARCIIIAAAMTDAVRERLYDLCRDAERLIFLLSEYGDVPNAFYIGGDAYRDGCEMARRYASYLETVRDHSADMAPPYLVTVTGNDNVSARARGFSDMLSRDPNTRDLPPQSLWLDPARLSNPKTLPSYLAARLTEVLSPVLQKTAVPVVLYVPLGLSGLSLALEKAGFSDGGENRVVCFCHDTAPERKPEGISPILCTCIQDVYTQGRTAVQLAGVYLLGRVYPAEKRIFVQSSFL